MFYSRIKTVKRNFAGALTKPHWAPASRPLSQVVPYHHPLRSWSIQLLHQKLLHVLQLNGFKVQGQIHSARQFPVAGRSLVFHCQGKNRCRTDWGWEGTPPSVTVLKSSTFNTDCSAAARTLWTFLCTFYKYYTHPNPQSYGEQERLRSQTHWDLSFHHWLHCGWNVSEMHN